MFRSAGRAVLAGGGEALNRALLGAALGVLIVLAAASGAAAGVDPCAKFVDADAYNNCLAGFGPAAGPARSMRAPPDDKAPRQKRPGARAKGPPQARKLEGPQAKPAGPKAKPAGGGRVRMEIMVPSGD